MTTTLTMQHFDALASILADNKEGIEAITFSRLVAQTAEFCREHNDHFDRDRFTAACFGDVPSAPRFGTSCRVCGSEFQPEISWVDVCPDCRDEWENDADGTDVGDDDSREE